MDEKRRLYQIEYRKTEQGKLGIKKYNQSEKGKVVQKRYGQSAKGKAKAISKKKKQDTRFPQKTKARQAVKNAMYREKMPRANTQKCHYCNKRAYLWHHHRGWSDKYKLDVIPACIGCDRKEHLNSFFTELDANAE